LAVSYAVVETGGKQYRVAPGDTVDVESLPANAGEQISLDRVLMVASDDGITVGNPTVAGASVKADVVMHDRADKIIVFKYKNKTRSRRKTGHRQGYTRLRIQEITL
jgi:large subunit ribosomal protein L21